MAIKSPTSGTSLQPGKVNLPHHEHLSSEGILISRIMNISPAKEIKSQHHKQIFSLWQLNLPDQDHLSIQEK